MARWPRGEAEIERLLGLRHLQAITGAAADGQPLLAKVGRTLATAASITRADPDSALVLAYDAARYAATALLAHKACGQPQPAAMSLLSRPSVPSSATASVGSATCAGAATSSSTRAPAPPLPMSMRLKRP